MSGIVELEDNVLFKDLLLYEMFLIDLQIKDLLDWRELSLPPSGKACFSFQGMPMCTRSQPPSGGSVYSILTIKSPYIMGTPYNKASIYITKLPSREVVPIYHPVNSVWDLSPFILDLLYEKVLVHP